MDQKTLFTIQVNDQDLSAALEKARDNVRRLNQEFKKSEQGSDGYNKLAKEVAGAKNEVSQLTERQKRLNNELKGLNAPKGSLIALRAEYSKLTQQVNNLSEAERNSKFGKSLITSAGGVKTKIDGIEQSIGRFTGNVGNYKSAFDGLFSGITRSAGLVGIAIAALAAPLLANANISDQIADVAKNADISTEAATRLSKALEFKGGTRTSLVDQLGIASIGGKLGVAEKDLLGFVESVDVVNVALGDQFGGSVETTTDVLGKLRNVLTDIKSDNVGQDIQFIGNSLNFLEAQGAASAGTIADFAGRIAGAGRNLGLTSGQIIGVSATLDELGVNAERGASGYVRILQRVAESPAEFAKAAGISAKEFTTLVNDDLGSAVNLFLEKINDKNLSNTAIADLLDTLKLDGVGTAEIVGKLGGSLDLLKERTQQAGKALGETSSIQQEFDKRNKTLGASVDGLKNSFSNLLTNGSVGGFFQSAVEGVTSLLDGLNDYTEKLSDFSNFSTGASQAQDILNESISQGVKELAKESVATEKNINILKNDGANREQRNNAVSDLVKLYPDLLTQQQLEAASSEDLSRLQVILTQNLRNQIAERQELRAKEALETARLQKQIRLVEIESTPDRALISTLSAGEIFRGNFLESDPQKIRARLSADLKKDITEIDQQIQGVDNTFKKIKATSDNGLNALEQDELDRRNQFTQRAGELRKEVKQTDDTIKNLDKKPKGGGTTKEDKGAAGSLDDLKDKVDKIQNALEKAAPNQIERILGDLEKAKKELEDLQSFIDAKISGAFVDREIQPLISTDNIQASLDASVNALREEIEKLKLKATVDLNFKTNQDLQKFASEIVSADTKAKEKAKEKEAEEKEKERQQAKEDAISSALDIAESVNASLANIKRQRLESETESELEAINIKEQKEIDAALGNQTKIAAAQLRAKSEREKVEKEAAEGRRQIALKEVRIATALAIINALTIPGPAGIIRSIAAAAAGLIQLNEIKKQKFEFGGGVKLGKHATIGGASHAQGGVQGVFSDGNRIEVERDEQLFVLKANNKKGINLLSRENQRRGGVSFFESGGRVPLPQVQASGAGGSISVTANLDNDQIKYLASLVASETANKTGAAVQSGLAVGLNDNNRQLERQQASNANRVL